MNVTTADSAESSLEYDGSCHCGAVTFHVKLLGGTDGGLASARRCDCSFCRMRGAVALTAAKDELTVLMGAEALTLYQFNTHIAKHYFCSVCGIYTHHQRRSDPDQLGVNAACLQGLSPFDFACVPVSNGHVHPSDDPDAPSLSGWLKFETAKQG